MSVSNQRSQGRSEGRDTGDTVHSSEYEEGAQLWAWGSGDTGQRREERQGES